MNGGHSVSGVASATPHTAGSLHALFAPRSIALVGATERSIWTTATIDNLRRFGFSGRVHLVNRRGGLVCGLTAATSCAAIGEPIDTALLMVPAMALEEAMADIARAGIAQAVVLTAGFAEAGEEGNALQSRLLAFARGRGIRLLGPNCLGFVNYLCSVPLWTLPVRKARRAGALALISQSGAMADEMAQFAHRQGVALGFIASTGNEADIDVAEVIHFVIDEPSLKGAALFLETVRDAARFASAAQRASDVGKPIVVLKVGASETSSRLAQTHTGALVGDDRLFDAVCHRYGLIRVASLEDLVLTADIVARLAPIGSGGLALGALSGGACEIAADRAAAEGLALPNPCAETAVRLASVLPAFAAPQNPLDVTGAAMLNPDMLAQGLAELGQDPGMAAVTFILDAPIRDDQGGFRSQALGAVARAFTAATKPAMVLSNTLNPLTDDGLAAVEAAGLLYSGAGIDRGVAALARSFDWHRRRTRARSELKSFAPTARPTAERDVLEHLADFGVPVIPGQVCTTAADTAAAAAAIGAPVVLKISASGVLHKSDIGGVVLDVVPSAAAASHDRLVAAVRAALPGVTIEGVIVSPMRSSGLELVIGIVRDRQWGPVLSVGIGGVMVEVLQDVSLHLLPADIDDVLAMLKRLRGAALLNGFRGSRAADPRVVADAVLAISRAAMALGSDLTSLEVNPLLVTGTQVEALDAVAEWRSGAGNT